ncbi:hypothetical protein HanRHA438_Chr11g0516481 [Helianthus annuus]|nr:hypothetical protein HanIR_Chr11g0542341 [Helianthus annuus]KAJ0871794.1 hypothetical protein HanRHA438_Chr11g0516481 [Helianthus annuus]
MIEVKIEEDEKEKALSCETDASVIELMKSYRHYCCVIVIEIVFAMKGRRKNTCNLFVCSFGEEDDEWEKMKRLN